MHLILVQLKSKKCFQIKRVSKTSAAITRPSLEAVIKAGVILNNK
jgi:hypothetical protein